MSEHQAATGRGARGMTIEPSPVYHMNENHDESGKFSSGPSSGTSKTTEKRVGKNGIEREVTVHVKSDGSPLPPHIASLKIPPAWEGVVYNDDPDADLLVRGVDAKGRGQYIYSKKFTETQAANKFARIKAMDEKFESMRSLNEANRAIPETKENADCMKVIMETGIRPGSDSDTGASKKAYGATTLLGQHVKETPSGVRLQYVGKKGVDLDIPIEDKETADMLLSRAMVAGSDGRIFNTDAGSLSAYSHSLDASGPKTKDFRTYLGTSTAREMVKSMPVPKSPTAYKKAVREVATRVSTKLGNTPTIALQSYIAPEVFSSWRLA